MFKKLWFTKFRQVEILSSFSRRSDQVLGYGIFPNTNDQSMLPVKFLFYTFKIYCY